MPSSTSGTSDDLELMWSSFCSEARQTLPTEDDEIVPVGFLPTEADDDLVAPDADSRRPPPLHGWEPDHEAQAGYISLLESFIDNREQQQPQPLQNQPLLDLNTNHGQLMSLSGEAQRLRRDNKLLHAKNTMLERLLRESNSRCRRAERRSPHTIKHKRRLDALCAQPAHPTVPVCVHRDQCEVAHAPQRAPKTRAR